MDTPQWRPQEIMVKPLIEEIISTNTTYQIQKPMLEIKKPKPQKEQAINCPRCNSINTKFCYFNNYSLTQPRYFCKTCRRYWTQGGSLRNIPVGGGSRKNKRSSNSVFSTSSKNLTEISDLVVTPQNLKIHHNEGQDLNLGLVQKNNNTSVSSSTTSTIATIASNSHVSAMELLNGITTSSSRGLHSFMPVAQVQASAAADPNTVYSNLGFHPLQDFKQVGMNFCLDGFGGSDYVSGGVQGETSSDQGRVLFPFEDLKQVSSTNTTLDLDQNNNKVQQGYSNGYWNGMLGGGSW